MFQGSRNMPHGIGCKSGHIQSGGSSSGGIGPPADAAGGVCRQALSRRGPARLWVPDAGGFGVNIVFDRPLDWPIGAAVALVAGAAVAPYRWSSGGISGTQGGAATVSHIWP